MLEAVHDLLQCIIPVLESTCREPWPSNLSVFPLNVHCTASQPDFILTTTDSSRAGVRQGLQACVLREKGVRTEVDITWLSCMDKLLEWSCCNCVFTLSPSSFKPMPLSFTTWNDQEAAALSRLLGGQAASDLAEGMLWDSQVFGYGVLRLPALPWIRYERPERASSKVAYIPSVCR